MVNRFPDGAGLPQILQSRARHADRGLQRAWALDREFLKDKPRFAEIAEEFAAFIDGATLVAHNASFDMGFINAEFERLGMPAVGMERVVDTVRWRRRKFPGAKASLDALCERFGISNAHRVKHGALLDAEILGRGLFGIARRQADGAGAGCGAPERSAGGGVERPPPAGAAAAPLSADEIAAHAAFVATLGGEGDLETAISSGRGEGAESELPPLQGEGRGEVQARRST